MFKNLKRIGLSLTLMGLGAVLLYDSSHPFMHSLVHTANLPVDSKEFWALTILATVSIFIGLIVFPARSIIKKCNEPISFPGILPFLIAISLAITLTCFLYTTSLWAYFLVLSTSGNIKLPLLITFLTLIVTLGIGNLLGIPILSILSRRGILTPLKIILVAGMIPVLVYISPNIFFPLSEGFSSGNSLGDIIISGSRTPIGWLQRIINLLGAFSYGAFAGAMCQSFLGARKN